MFTSPQRSVSSLGMQGVSGRLLSDTTKVSRVKEVSKELLTGFRTKRKFQTGGDQSIIQSIIQ